MLSIDFENQIIFVIAIVFVFTMEVVLMRIEGIRRPDITKNETLRQIARSKLMQYWFLGFYLVTESIILTLKGIIYLTDKEWSKTSISAIQAIFLVLHIARSVYPIFLQVKVA